MRVTKRDGTLEDVALDKIYQVIKWACEGLDNVSISEIELKAHIMMYEGISTSDIHELLIKSAADLISADTPNYQYVAARLDVFHLRKQVYGSIKPISLLQHIVNKVGGGWYDKDLIEKYDYHEIGLLGTYVDHDNDMNFTYAAMVQWRGKYLVQNRITKEILETPQMAYMLIAMAGFQNEPSDTRLQLVADLYISLSEGSVQLPTPIMGGLRTPTRQFSSCVLIECGDSLDEINATSNAVIKYISQRAGIGINIGRIRALGSEIRGGEAYHTGLIPFIKHFKTAVKSCSQGGLRGGAATLFYPIWHLEVESLLVLKNNRGVEENRVRQLDYGVQLNRLMYQRMIEDGYITLFSPSDVPGLYDAFFEDQDEFERLYKIYEVDENIRKKRVKAIELFTQLAQERAQTGRIYIQNVDHCNTHSPFNPKKAPIRQSNLCLEVCLPTTPIPVPSSPEGEIALCTLAAFNLGVEGIEEKLEKLSDIIVRFLDNLLDYQSYPISSALKAKDRRALGVGVTNFAYYVAKDGKYYSNGSANNLTHEIFEAIQYNLLKASMKLAKERGKCGYYGDTTYSKGTLPIDSYKASVDDLHTQKYLHDWEALRADIKQYGLRNSTVTAVMPCETSSQITNSTNGIEPPRSLVVVKGSKDRPVSQVVPGVGTINYELLWDIPNNTGYLELVAIMQKFVDQSISANTNYDPSKFVNGKVPIMTVLQDIILAYKLGLKTLYYHNTRDDPNADDDDNDCLGGACKL